MNLPKIGFFVSEMTGVAHWRAILPAAYLFRYCRQDSVIANSPLSMNGKQEFWFPEITVAVGTGIPRAGKVPYFFSIDDDPFHYTQHSGGRRNKQARNRIKQTISVLLKDAKGVIVTTEILKQKLRANGINKPIYVSKNVIDFRDITALYYKLMPQYYGTPIIRTFDPRSKNAIPVKFNIATEVMKLTNGKFYSGEPRIPEQKLLRFHHKKPWFDICWMGSDSHLEEIEKALPVIKRFCNEREDVRLTLSDIWGNRRDKSLFPEQTRFLRWCGFPDYIQQLINWNWDVYLSILDKVEFNRNKSNIKWLEATANGSVLLTANTEPFAEVTPEMGLVYEDLEDLYDKLEFAYQNRDNRYSWVNNSLKYLCEHYDPAKEMPKLYEWMEKYK